MEAKNTGTEMKRGQAPLGSDLEMKMLLVLWEIGHPTTNTKWLESVASRFNISYRGREFFALKRSFQRYLKKLEGERVVKKNNAREYFFDLDKKGVEITRRIFEDDPYIRTMISLIQALESEVDGEKKEERVAQIVTTSWAANNMYQFLAVKRALGKKRFEEKIRAVRDFLNAVTIPNNVLLAMALSMEPEIAERVLQRIQEQRKTINYSLK